MRAVSTNDGHGAGFWERNRRPRRGPPTPLSDWTVLRANDGQEFVVSTEPIDARPRFVRRVSHVVAPISNPPTVGLVSPCPIAAPKKPAQQSVHPGVRDQVKLSPIIAN